MPSSSYFGSRRDFLIHSIAGAAAISSLSQASPSLGENPKSASDLVARIDRTTIFRGRQKGTTWFSTRACMLPHAPRPRALMLMASITGSDYFGPVHVTESDDLGREWSKPEPVPGLGRTDLPDGVQETVCDMVPEYHAPTNSVLAMGHNVFYRGKSLPREMARQAVYISREPAGNWSELKKLAWNDPRGAYIYTCNCAQRATLPGGDVLVPLSFGAKSDSRSATTVRCSFDGRDMKVQETGRELKMAKGRGFLEPSLAALDGKFYLTLRAEDSRGYVSTSDDGLAWSDPIAWTWDNGEPLAMSTTQQRWLPHSDALYLVYTRKTPENGKVMRWRSPLFMARVDRQKMCLLRDTERTVLPMSADGLTNPGAVAHLGNFHTTIATPGESWVTVGEMLPGSYRGDVLLARIEWSAPNQLAPFST